MKRRDTSLAVLLVSCTLYLLLGAAVAFYSSSRAIYVVCAIHSCVIVSIFFGDVVLAALRRPKKNE